ncbi:phosphoprotein [European bat lyssavirus 1]|uniref:Phosphoprotein n=1 Tax=European bat lyssavirus 1 TaxID=57482 RepID=A0A212MH66_9RHAB|nr:phosphoprotein [European bat lyssavirus 1]
MSKIFVNPSALRSGLADLEMAEETVDLVNKNMEDSQAHLQGIPIDVETLPEDIRRLKIADCKQGQQEEDASRQEEGEDEDFYMTESENSYVPLQSYLDAVGMQIVRKMKTGDGFFKIWAQAVEDIVSYVATNFPAPVNKPHADKSTQTTLEKVKQATSSSAPSKREGPSSNVNLDPQESSGPPGLDWAASNDEDDGSIEAEIAHQIAESFSKKYKFPSRSSGIFLWNFEQLKMNLDDIVREVKGIPGVTRMARDGMKLPLRCMLGSVASNHSKRFQILVNSAKLGKLMQDDLNRYLAY